MRAGKRNQLVELQEKVITAQNSFGEDTYTWEPVQVFWANVTALAGRELETMQQRFAEAKFKVVIDFMDGIEYKKDRTLLWRGRRLDILQAEDPTPGRREMHFICKEYVS